MNTNTPLPASAVLAWHPGHVELALVVGGTGRDVVNGVEDTDTSEATPLAPIVEGLGSFQSEVLLGGYVDIFAWGVVDYGGEVQSVAFYRDANANGTLEIGTDVLLANDTDESDGWGLNISTTTWTAGTYTLLVQATDVPADEAEKTYDLYLKHKAVPEHLAISDQAIERVLTWMVEVGDFKEAPPAAKPTRTLILRAG